MGTVRVAEFGPHSITTVIAFDVNSAPPDTVTLTAVV